MEIKLTIGPRISGKTTAIIKSIEDAIFNDQIDIAIILGSTIVMCENVLGRIKEPAVARCRVVTEWDSRNGVPNLRGLHRRRAGIYIDEAELVTKDSLTEVLRIAEVGLDIITIHATGTFYEGDIRTTTMGPSALEYLLQNKQEIKSYLEPNLIGYIFDRTLVSEENGEIHCSICRGRIQLVASKKEIEARCCCCGESSFRIYV